MASPDINTEDFSAAVDYLSCRDDVDGERTGIVGICGWGGIAVNATAADPRIKATIAVTSYILTELLQFADEIESAVMVLHGERVHSRYMGERVHSRYMGEMIFDKLQGDNKQLIIVPGASHYDFYDGGATGAIPWDAIEAFFGKYL